MKPAKRIRRVSTAKFRKFINSMAEEIEEITAGTVKDLRENVCKFRKSTYLCIAYHLIQATESPTAIAAGLFYGHGHRDKISSVPCGALMRPQPVSGGKQRGAELLLFQPSEEIIKLKCFI